MAENITFSYSTIKKNVRLHRTNIDIEADSFHKELKCVFCFVMILHDYQQGIFLPFEPGAVDFGENSA